MASWRPHLRHEERGGGRVVAFLPPLHHFTLALAARMKTTLALPSAVFAALYYATLGAATPFPPGAAALLPDTFELSPLISPPPPTSDYDSLAHTDAHIVRDSYIIVLDDSLDAHEVDRHHASVESLHRADQRLRSLKAQGSASPHEALDGVKHKFHVGGKKQRSHRRKNQLKGYAGSFSESTVDAIRAMKGVKYVERDSVVHASDVEKGAPWVRPLSLRSFRPPSPCRVGPDG